MRWLVDGYNVMYAGPFLGRARGPAGIERGRHALLNFVAGAVEPDERPRITIVFDAAQAPRDLPAAHAHQGLHIVYSAGWDDADALLEALIRQEGDPRNLTVVSSDRRVRIAAERRRAHRMASEDWLDHLHRTRANRAHAPAEPEDDVKPATNDVEFWLRTFNDVPRANAPPRKNVPPRKPREGGT